MSPTVLREGPYRFFFYAGDRLEPPHVHVESGNGEAKFWLDPVTLAEAWGYSLRELHTIERILEAHADEVRGVWDAFFRT